MKTHLAALLRLSTVLSLFAASARADVRIQSEHLNPADPAWSFKTIPRPSKSDIAAAAQVAMAANQFEAAAADGAVLVNGVLPTDSLDLSEAALLSNTDADDGCLVLDLGRVQSVAAVATYSWHEWDVDQGSRGPQVYTLYGSAAAGPDPGDLSVWTRLADVDTRPNQTGARWNGQHGVFITDSSGKLGEFRHLLFAIERTRSPLQPNPRLTGTLFVEIDVHTAETLARAGDATGPVPPQAEHLWVVFKTHLDIGYTETIERVLEKYRVTMMDDALRVIEDSRELPLAQRFSWTLAGWPLTHVLGPEQDPARRARIEQAVRAGEIAFHALPYTTHTETQDLEELVRGLGHATRLSRRYGRPLPISGKMTDVPSHSWVMPTLLSHAGVKFLQLGCNSASAFVRVPQLFWWEGPDGSRVLCAYTRYYGSGLRPPRDWPSKHYLAMMMTGDNEGPHPAAYVESLRQQAAHELPGMQVHFGTLDDFANAVLAEKPELDVVRADMPDTWIHGWMSMPQEAGAARRFRPLEPALELLDTHLRAWGVDTGNLAPALAEAYELSGLYSEHTFGPWGPNGSSWNSGTPRNLYGEAWAAAYARGAYAKYEAAFDDKRAFARKANGIVNHELAARMDLLARSVRSDGARLVVYNALPWTRSGLVEVPGQPGRTLFAEDVPAGGYRTYALARAAGASSVRPETPGAFETPFYKVAFDLDRGGIASLVEKKTGREWVDRASALALGQFLHERFDQRQMLAYHKAYGRESYSWPRGDLPKDIHYAAVTLSGWNLQREQSDHADVVTLTAADTCGLAKGVALRFTFPRRQPWLEVEWRVTDKTADPLPEGGWLCFPVAITQPQFLLGRLGGPIDPAKDIVAGANRHYFCLNNGLTITGPDGAGLGLCPLDSSCVSLGEPGLWKFSLGDAPRRAAAFVNLYNNQWNTNFPEWQGGSWSSRVRLWLNPPDVGLAQGLIVPSWDARLPLLAVVADGPGGPLPPTQTGLSVSRAGVLVTAFGQNPDGGGTLLRVWEQAGASGDCTVDLPEALKANSARPVNLRGEALGNPLPVRSGRLRVGLQPFAPCSFVLE